MAVRVRRRVFRRFLEGSVIDRGDEALADQLELGPYLIVERACSGPHGAVGDDGRGRRGGICVRSLKTSEWKKQSKEKKDAAQPGGRAQIAVAVVAAAPVPGNEAKMATIGGAQFES